MLLTDELPQIKANPLYIYTSCLIHVYDIFTTAPQSKRFSLLTTCLNNYILNWFENT